MCLLVELLFLQGLRVLLQPRASRLQNRLLEVGQLVVGLLQFNRSAAQAAVHKRHRAYLLLAVEASLLVQWESRLPHRVSRLQRFASYKSSWVVVSTAYSHEVAGQNWA